MRIFDAKGDDVASWLGRRVLPRNAEIERIVADIIEDVRVRGDDAVLDNARRFDAPQLTDFHLSDEDRDTGIEEISARSLSALATAYQNVFNFHAAQMDVLFGHIGEPQPSRWLPGRPSTGARGWANRFRQNDEDSGICGQQFVPIESVGIYVPGGRAAYPSSVIMNAAPARVAGVPKVFVATPARPDGTLHPAVREAIRACGIAGTIMVGGAAAIAAFAFGTRTVPRVDKVAGPGNRYVNEAKRQLWGRVGVDGQAGSSEVCVVVDHSSNAAYAAADYLTQIEHAPDNVGYLISVSTFQLGKVLEEIDRQLSGAPREATMREAIKREGVAIVARDMYEAIDLVNLLAPEHLTLAVEDSNEYLNYVRNAGCILLGSYTPQSAADYCMGPSHTLPTGGAARWQGALNVLDFLKVQSFAYMEREDLDPLIPVIEAMGDMEGFAAHARGGTIRYRD